MIQDGKADLITGYAEMQNYSDIQLRIPIMKYLFY